MEFKEKFVGGSKDDIEVIAAEYSVQRALECGAKVVDGQDGPLLFASSIDYAMRALKKQGLVDENGKLTNPTPRIFLRNKKTGQVEDQFMKGSEAAEK